MWGFEPRNLGFYSKLHSMTVQGPELYAFLGCAAIPAEAQPLNPKIVMVESVLKKVDKYFFFFGFISNGWLKLT